MNIKRGDTLHFHEIGEKQMNREEMLSLLKQSWVSLEKRFKRNTILTDSTFKVKSRQPYDRDSPIRRLGAEPYLQAALYSELSKLSSDKKDFVLGVEGKAIFDKHPDILGWKRSLWTIPLDPNRWYPSKNSCCPRWSNRKPSRGCSSKRGYSRRRSFWRW